jgi:hypothetical protein
MNISKFYQININILYQITKIEINTKSINSQILPNLYGTDNSNKKQMKICKFYQILTCKKIDSNKVNKLLSGI